MKSPRALSAEKMMKEITFVKLGVLMCIALGLPLPKKSP